jgi:putative phosphoribosyl transferase
VDAGTRLADKLEHLRGEDVVVLGLPRGGVPVAFEVAQALAAPLDVVIVRKLGVPFQPELGMGAIGEGGARILDRHVLRYAGVDEAGLAAVERRERAVLERAVTRLRGERSRVALHGRTAVVVDDGVATGSTARLACQVARAHGAARVVLAVPVAPRSSIAKLADVADEVVCLMSPEPFHAVGASYRDFSQTSDEEVTGLLYRAAVRVPAQLGLTSSAAEAAGRDGEVELFAGQVRLAGHLSVPAVLRGFVVFAHGSASSRLSPRNRLVATVLNEAGLGTLLFDLLTPVEQLDQAQVFNVEVMADRLGEVTRWLRARPDASRVRIGYFGASTGAAAALAASAHPDADIGAVVSRGGRPDLAGPRLAEVRAPTLLIVGGNDTEVLECNRRARSRLRCHNDLAVVPGASHLFDEPGALAAAAGLALDWFLRHLTPTPDPVGRRLNPPTRGNEGGPGAGRPGDIDRGDAASGADRR